MSELDETPYRDADARLAAILTRLDNLPTVPAADLALGERSLPLAVLDTNVVFDV